MNPVIIGAKYTRFGKEFMRKLIGSGDIKMLVVNASTKGNWIPSFEMKEVLSVVNEATYTLYSVYRTHPFHSSESITDTAVSSLIGWTERKVQKHRLALERANLFRMVRYGTRTDGITKVFVGFDTVALFDAGLPAEILEPKAFNKLKKAHRIKDPKELVAKADLIAMEFEQNPERYS